MISLYLDLKRGVWDGKFWGWYNVLFLSSFKWKHIDSVRNRKSQFRTRHRFEMLCVCSPALLLYEDRTRTKKREEKKGFLRSCPGSKNNG